MTPLIPLSNLTINTGGKLAGGATVTNLELVVLRNATVDAVAAAWSPVRRIRAQQVERLGMGRDGAETSVTLCAYDESGTRCAWPEGVG